MPKRNPHSGPPLGSHLQPLETADDDRDAQDAPPDDPSGADLNDPLPDVSPSAEYVQDRAEVEDARQLGGGVQRELAYEEEAEDQRTLQILETMRSLEHADEIEWRITRVGAEDPTLNGFLEAWPSSLMTLERLRDKFGGGKYHCHGTRRGRYFAHKTITIAGDAVRRNLGSKMETGSNFNMQEFLLQQQREDERRRERQAQDDQRRREDEDRREERRMERMLSIITAVAAAAAPIVTAFAGKRDQTADLIAALKPKDVDPLALIRLMKEMRELEGPRAPQADALDKAIGLVEKFKDMGALGGGSEIGWLDIVKEAVRTVGPGLGTAITGFMEQAAAAKAIEANRAQPRPGQPLLAVPVPAQPSRSMPSASAPGSFAAGSSPPAAPAPVGTAASPFSSAVEGEDDMLLKLLPLLPWFKGETERLIVAAARGSDAGMRAAVMYDDMPDDADIEAVGTVLSRADWFNLFQQLDSRVTQYPDFFAQVRQELLTMISEDTGVVFAAKDPAGTDPKSGRPVVSVRGPGARRDPNAPIERPTGPPPITGEVVEES
jgi:hypothetical protein